ncbi:hypothetical protein PR048_017531 [Dryococelus australis]|uniref:Uncharacterized protein n=1 Tax=Dryococelus australis TaxID=614101 RepID=A0ABQ9H9T2_9NEOP|nr:hypothetical protein PR048_017531 [Dryococelus australis]
MVETDRRQQRSLDHPWGRNKANSEQRWNANAREAGVPREKHADHREERRVVQKMTSGTRIYDCEHQRSEGVTGRLDYWTADDLRETPVTGLMSDWTLRGCTTFPIGRAAGSVSRLPGADWRADLSTFRRGETISLACADGVPRHGRLFHVLRQCCTRWPIVRVASVSFSPHTLYSVTYFADCRPIAPSLLDLGRGVPTGVHPTLKSEVLRADNVASSGTIPTCENPVTQPEIEPGSPWCEATRLTAQSPQPTSAKWYDLQGKLYSRMYTYAFVNSTLVVCCHSGMRRMGQSSPRDVKHRSIARNFAAVRLVLTVGAVLLEATLGAAVGRGQATMAAAVLHAARAVLLGWLVRAAAARRVLRLGSDKNLVPADDMDVINERCKLAWQTPLLCRLLPARI